MPEKPHYSGHRQRLRSRFLKEGGVEDYELIEMLLFQGNPRQDTKPLAKHLLIHFGSIGHLLSAPHQELSSLGCNMSTISAIKLAHTLGLKMMQERLQDKSESLDHFYKIIEYLKKKLFYKKNEEFIVLYLNKSLKILQEETHQKGTIDKVNAYPREIIKRALEIQASRMVLVHNHPSTRATPSLSDIELTRKIVEAGRALEIQVVDHIIIGRTVEGAVDHVSMKGLGYF